MTLNEVLKRAGLEDKEARVYLAGLELGQASAARIAQKAVIKRPTTYVILEQLKNKGLIEILPKGKATIFKALEPDDFLRIYEERFNALKQVLPQLKAITNIAEAKPKIRFYEGKEALINLYDNEIFRQKNILALANIAAFTNFFGQEQLNYFLNKLKTGGSNLRELIDDSEIGRQYVEQKSKLGLGETRLIPKDMKFDVDLLIYSDITAIISLNNGVAVVIEDVAITNAQKILFENFYGAIKKAP